MTRIIEIDNLSKYIQYINKIPDISYYRGEDATYSSRNAAAFRPYEFTWNSAEPFPFIKMIDEFYKEVAYKLTDDKIDFIAFAQHHGIPTNLLDITTSPLVALYFACQGSEDDTGVVYLASNSYIDVTELIHKYPNKNLIEEVFSNTPNELMLLIPIFEQYKKEHPKDFADLLKNLISWYLEYFSSPSSGAEKLFYRKLKRKKFDVWQCIYYLWECSEEIKQFTFANYDEEVYFYLALQFFFLKRIREYTMPMHTISFLPNMLYQPIIKFERGRSQQGMFLYQGYMTYIEGAYNFRVLTEQHLYFQNIELYIQNKAQILKELDTIGINRKTLFCDYDSIARYIYEKYSVLKEKDKFNPH